MVDIGIPEGRRIKIAAEYYTRLTSWIDNNGKWAGLGDDGADGMMDYIHTRSREFFLAKTDYLKLKSEEFDNEYG